MAPPRHATMLDRALVDELDRMDAAFAGNRLLSTFPREARALIEPDAVLIELRPGQRLFGPGDSVDASIFPCGAAMISMIVELPGDRSVEVASIGREGAIGGIVSCGHAPAFSEARVLIGGPALRIPMTALADAKDRSPFIGNLFCRYSDFLLAQVMQSVACNAFHGIAHRAARWLMTAQDRAGDRIALTQEELAGLLGVQRTSLNEALRKLQDEGLIESGRGVVRVVDRAGLRERACVCYRSIERHFAGVIGASGVGGINVERD